MNDTGHLFICREHEKCDIEDCRWKYTHELKHVRWWYSTKLRYFKVNCSLYGQSIMIRWKGDKNGNNVRDRG